MNAVAIQSVGLRKTYKGGVEAVRGVDLVVPRGECFGLLGPNGAGKTTTIEILEGLLAKTAGEVEILGMKYEKEDRAIRQRIGVSLQETKLSEKLTVRETLRLFRSFYAQGLTPEAAFGLVDLGEKADAHVGKLSGGQKQRLAVACAMVGDPELLFLDEPTTGLDPQSRRHLWDILRRFRSEGRTTLLTTHYMDEAEKLCDRVAIVDHGKVIALGSPKELIASVGGDHVIEATVEGASPLDPQHFAKLPAVTEARLEGPILVLMVNALHLALPTLLRTLTERGQTLVHLSTRQASLEDVFVKLTGRHLRDDDASRAA